MNSQNSDALRAADFVHRDLLTAALNKNQVTFSQVAKTAEQLSNGALKLKTDPMNKEFVFEYMNKKAYIDLNALRIGGLKYLNNILIDSILTTVELDEVYKIIDQVKDELLNKADKVHTHSISDVDNLQSTLNGKADKVHTHSISDVNNLQSTLNGKADKVHTHSISDVDNLQSTLNGKADRIITGTLRTGINESGTKGAAQIFGPLTTTLTFKGHWSQQRQGLGPKYELEIDYNNKGKVLKVINARLNVAGNMGAGVSWGHRMPLTIMNYNNEPYLVLHTYYCQSWLGSYFDIDGIGNSSISNFKTVLQTELSEITEPTITIAYTTADQDRITALEELSHEPYDDSELKTLINTKANSTHTHTISDITDYTAYDDTELRTKLNACETEMANKAEIITNNTNRIKDLETGIVDFGIEVVNHSQILNSLTSTIVNLVYPVGSIYMSTNNNIMDPADIFPNTKWSTLSGAFLLPDIKAGLEGGSKKITVDNLPPHYHKYKIIEPYDRNGYPDGSDDTSNGYAANESYWRGNKEATATFNGSTDTGNGTDYMPPYYTVKAWRRIE